MNYMSEKEIIKLCESGQFDQAVKEIDKYLSTNEGSSNIYRIKGQALLELSTIDPAIDSLVQALKMNPENVDALILIGNIYGGVKKDPDTALTYFTQVLELRPNDHLTLSNIGSVISLSGRHIEGIPYFEQALSAKKNYPNALLGLAIISFREKDYLTAFDKATLCLKSCNIKSVDDLKILPSAEKLMLEIAEEYSSSYDESEHENKLLQELRSNSEKPIEMTIDSTIPTPALIQIAEYRNQEKHLIKYKADNKFTYHYLYHELLHLRLILEARTTDDNELFKSTHEQYDHFKKKFSSIKKGLIEGGVPESKTEGFFQQLHQGLNSQLYNAPIDLFIEDIIYNEFPHLRPIQFLSIRDMIRTVFGGFNSPNLAKIVPSVLRNTNLVLAIPTILQFKEFYGLDFTLLVQNKGLVTRGVKLYGDFLQLREDRSPGEEYDIVRWWAEELSLDGFFEFDKETKHDPNQVSSSQSAEDFLDQLEKDPYGLNSDRSAEEEELKQFRESLEKSGVNMAVVMHITSSLGYYKNLSTDQIKKIGFEIAELGRHGIDPSKSDVVSLASVPGKEFTGWKLLSWMYSSFAAFEPGLEKSLGISFEREYEAAKKLST